EEGVAAAPDSARSPPSAVLGAAADALEALAARPFRLEEYGAAWAESEATCRPAADALAGALAQVRAAHAAGALDAAPYAAVEGRLARALDLLARGLGDGGHRAG
ncbi:MAG TPA: hypothetical protein VNL77_05525, partial [Roseiflexaceae bacterium]|nr:hypothetical protein [Roseiflexaceae bacterium]